jgi:hypothetical protein
MYVIILCNSLHPQNSLFVTVVEPKLISVLLYILHGLNNCFNVVTIFAFYLKEKIVDLICIIELDFFIGTKPLFSCSHSFEYCDKEETIIANLVRGIDVFMKTSADWPLSSYGLKLISIRNSGTHPTSITSSLLGKTKVGKRISSDLQPMLCFRIFFMVLRPLKFLLK